MARANGIRLLTSLQCFLAVVCHTAQWLVRQMHKTQREIRVAWQTRLYNLQCTGHDLRSDAITSKNDDFSFILASILQSSAGLYIGLQKLAAHQITPIPLICRFVSAHSIATCTSACASSHS